MQSPPLLSVWFCWCSHSNMLLPHNHSFTFTNKGQTAFVAAWPLFLKAGKTYVCLCWYLSTEQIISRWQPLQWYGAISALLNSGTPHGTYILFVSSSVCLPSLAHRFSITRINRKSNRILLTYSNVSATLVATTILFQNLLHGSSKRFISYQRISRSRPSSPEKILWFIFVAEDGVFCWFSHAPNITSWLNLPSTRSLCKLTFSINTFRWFKWNW